MTATARCFLIEQTGRVRREAIVMCKHDHRAIVTTVEGTDPDEVKLSWDDVDWPADCATCAEPFGYEHDTGLQWLSLQRQWTRRETGETHWGPHEFGPGAMWDADWMPSSVRSPDGRYLVTILPNGCEWAIDSQARNCTRPGEDHDCWNRHGEPPNLTVDKTPNPGRSTCDAGAGSIQAGDWHGFLREGVLEP